MRYKTVYMPHPDVEGEWFDTEDEAWNSIGTKGCGLLDENNRVRPCEMCQAEWEVFSEKEIEEIEAEMSQRTEL